MNVLSFAPAGYRGYVVTVEVDVRRGIPGTDVVGLAGAAVREARERVRAAIRNAALQYPRDRVLINLGPADIPKSGNRFDLGIAAALLEVTGQGSKHDSSISIMALGELSLDGWVRSTRGVISAVVAGKSEGISRYVVPWENAREAEAVGGVSVCGIRHLREWPQVADRVVAMQPADADHPPTERRSTFPDLADIRGNPVLKRALEIAAAGCHHLLLVGPPGTGKTMAALRLPGLLPTLSPSEALEVTRIHSAAGSHDGTEGLRWDPPFRCPHHSATLQGMVGGGREVVPGEISLAHRGVLFLDELPEFRPSVLQALREPVESGVVRIPRAGSAYSFPAACQLVVAANLCPCGNLGRSKGHCLCSVADIQRYWKRVGRALLDRIDLRCTVTGMDADGFLTSRGEGSAAVSQRVSRARAFRDARVDLVFSQALDATITGRGVDRTILRYDSPDDLRRELRPSARTVLERARERLGFSGRALDSVLRVARTIADLNETELIDAEAVGEAIQHRRLGEIEGVWQDWQSSPSKAFSE